MWAQLKKWCEIVTLVFVWCPQLLQNQRYSSNMIDHWQNPTHRATALGTSRSPDWFCWFLCMLYWKVLAAWWSLSIVCSLLVTRDELGKFSHLLQTVIIAESAIIIWKNCVVQMEIFSSYHSHCTNTECELFIVSYCIWCKQSPSDLYSRAWQCIYSGM